LATRTRFFADLIMGIVLPYGCYLIACTIQQGTTLYNTCRLGRAAHLRRAAFGPAAEQAQLSRNRVRIWHLFWPI